MKLLLLFILVIVAVIIVGSATKAANTNMVLFSGKIIDFTLVTYIGLLLLATIVTVGISIKQQDAISERVSAEEITKAVKSGEKFLDYVQTGMLTEANGVFVSKEWHFPYKANRLVVTSKSRDGSQNWIVVEREKELDENEQVDIIQYATKSIIDDYDYSHQLKPPSITVNDQGIIIEPSKRTELKLAKFSKEFTVNQFTDPQSAKQHIYRRVDNVMGQKVIYIRVPESIEVVEGEGVYLQFVD